MILKVDDLAKMVATISFALYFLNFDYWVKLFINVCIDF